MEYRTIIEKFNPYHDKLGRFCGAEGSSFMTYRTKDSKKQHMADLAIERAKESQSKKTTSTPEDAAKPVDWDSAFSNVNNFDDFTSLLEKEMPGLMDIANKWKETAYEDAINKKTKGDLILSDIYELRGFSGKPKLLTDEEFEKAAKRSGVFYRGFHDSQSSSKTGEQKADEFIDGKTYAGFGNYGNGTYVVKETNGDTIALATARDYSDLAKKSIVKLTVSGNSLWGNHGEIYRERNTFKNNVKSFRLDKLNTSGDSDTSITEKKEIIYSVCNIIDDEGKYAALRGYDGYHCGNATSEHHYNVILNQSNVIISEKRYE